MFNFLISWLKNPFKRTQKQFVSTDHLITDSVVLLYSEPENENDHELIIDEDLYGLDLYSRLSSEPENGLVITDKELYDLDLTSGCESIMDEDFSLPVLDDFDFCPLDSIDHFFEDGQEVEIDTSHLDFL